MLLGSGRSHLLLLRRARAQLGKNLQITLVAPDRFALYPALLPEVVSGQLGYRESHIDLQLLCEKTGARLITSELASLDLDARIGHLSNGVQIQFDLVSLDGDLECAAEAPESSRPDLRAKPLSRFLPSLQSILEDIYQHPKGANLALVGDDEASVELALAIRQRLSSDPRVKNLPVLHLVHEGRSVLPHLPVSAQLLAAQALQEQHIRVHPLFPATGLEEGRLVSERGQHLPADAVIWCQADRATLPVEEGIGLARGELGLIKVNRQLQSVSHAFVFASGAWAQVDAPSYASSRISWAYQTPVLNANLVRYLRGKELKVYKEPKKPLNFIKLGEDQVVALRGDTLLSGTWVKHWKKFIDRRFIGQFPRP